MRTSRHCFRLLGSAALIGSVVLLAGCDGNKLTRTFGLTRDAPDEYTVTTRAPLSMPPDYALRPPRPGVPRPQDVSERNQAQEILVPQTALGSGTTAAPTAGQAALLQQAGPAAPPNIRQRVDQDAKMEQADQGFIDKLLYWRTPDTQHAVVDPQREAQRIQQNAALGKSQESGETPIIQPRKKGWFQDLFSWL